jgi:cytochrome c556
MSARTNRPLLTGALLAFALAGAACERASPPPTPAPSASSAASVSADDYLAEPGEIIEARRLLMTEAERLMKPIDSYTLGEPAEPAELRSLATTLEPMLLALPHLFPPSTNLFDPAVIDPPTIALPAIWQRFPAFRAMAENSEHAAAQLRETGDDPAALKAASERLRTSCDACHRAFTRPYTPPVVTDEDLEFDFESALPPQ